MSYNYNSLLGRMMPRKKGRGKDTDAAEQSRFSSVQLFFAASVLSLFGASNAIAQQTIIDPAAAGGFELGTTFQANGWTVANQGSGIIKWALGTAASGGGITGKSA